MKRRILGLLTVVMTAALLLSGCGSSTSVPTAKSSNASDIQAIKDRGVLKAGVKVDVPKFGYKDPQSGNIEGFEVDIVKALSKKILGDENKVELVGVSAKTRGALIDNSELDVIVATVTITEERKKSYNFSDDYYVDGVGFLVKKAANIKDFKGLNGKKIAVTQGTTTKKAIQEEADKQGIKVDILEFATFSEAKSALDAGRVDVFSVDAAVLAGFLDDSTMLLPERYSPQHYGVMMKKSNEALAKLVNDTITEMKKSGEIDKLMQKWGIK